MQLEKERPVPAAPLETRLMVAPVQSPEQIVVAWRHGPKLVLIRPADYLVGLWWVGRAVEPTERLPRGHVWLEGLIPPLAGLVRPGVGWERPCEVPERSRNVEDV